RLGCAKARPYNVVPISTPACASWRRKLVGKFEANDAPEGLHAVFPGDFLSFFIGAASVGDGDLVDAPTMLGDFCGDFGFEAEAIGANLDALQDFLAKNFVAGLHVGEFE